MMLLKLFITPTPNLIPNLTYTLFNQTAVREKEWKEQLDALMLKKVGGGAGDTRDTLALKAEIQRLEQIVSKQEKVIGEYERIWSDVSGSTGTTDGGGDGSGDRSLAGGMVNSSSGAARLRALMLSYRNEKEQTNTHFDDLKARYQRLASDIDKERENHKTQMEQLRSSATNVEQMNKQTESLQAERNRLRVELDSKLDEADTKTKELNYVKGIYRYTH